MVRGNENVALFSDVHRWLAHQSDEIENLRARHQRLNGRRKEAIQACNQQLQRDTAERRKQVNEFSLELEQYTLRKFDLLKDDVIAAHVQQRFEDAGNEADDFGRKQRDIRNVCRNLDEVHNSLHDVAASMVNLVENCCGPAEWEQKMAAKPAALGAIGSSHAANEARQ
mmetsp:Transcript_21511/g.59656  ORF Transcript_21511/g.59656 Transcript_21511/m.59656 type:complete len:169 (-) Transcript_21511:82-588(-)